MEHIEIIADTKGLITKENYILLEPFVKEHIKFLAQASSCGSTVRITDIPNTFDKRLRYITLYSVMPRPLKDVTKVFIDVQVLR